MRTYATRDIRTLLRGYPDGLDAKAIAERVDRAEKTVRQLLKNMPDTYIDRWEGPTRGQYTAIWCVVIPPDDCPHPTRRSVAVPNRKRSATQVQNATQTQTY